MSVEELEKGTWVGKWEGKREDRGRGARTRLNKEEERLIWKVGEMQCRCGRSGKGREEKRTDRGRRMENAVE